MAEASCISFGSKSMTNLSLFIPHYLLSKPFFPLPTLSFHHSNVAQRSTKRTRSKQLHRTCLCSPNSPDFDVVSTYEHSDGSLVFCFGDPSELVKNDKLSETNLNNEEMKGEDNGDFNVVKVLDGDHKREVIIKKIDREVKSNGLIEVADKTDSDSAVEEENSSIEMSTSGSVKVETPVSFSSVERNNSFAAIVEAKDVVNVEEGIEMNIEESIEMNIEESIEMDNSSGSVVEVEDDVNVEECTEMNNSSGSDSIKVEMLVSVSSVEGNDLSGSIVEVKDVVYVEESLEKNDSSRSVVEVEDVVHVEENPVDKDGDDSSALPDLSRLDHDSGPEDQGASSKTLEPIIDSNSLQESVSVKLDSVDEVLGDDVHQETSQNVEVVHSSATVDALNVQAEVQDGIIRDSGEADIIEMMPLSPPSEAEPILDEEARFDTMEESGETERIKNTILVGETDIIEMMPPSPPSEAEPILDEEAGLGTIEESGETDRSENTIMLGNSSKLVLEMEMTKETVGSDQLVDASTSEVLEPESSRSDLQSEESASSKLFLKSGATLLLHPQKALTGGEDAYFICQNWLGVADGIGQWSLEGINPGVYAKNLMENCQKIVSEYIDVPTDPEKVLSLTVAKADSPGSSTVLIAHFDGQALHVANIGDSGFIILRNNAVCLRSSPMLHEFNFPVQIERDDDPSKLTESYKIDLEEGNVVVIATDGLFDNLYEQEIRSIVLKSMEADKNPEEIAEILAKTAQETGKSTSTRTPFADAAQAAGYVGYTGGKPDNVAVIVSLVEKGSNS